MELSSREIKVLFRFLLVHSKVGTEVAESEIIKIIYVQGGRQSEMPPRGGPRPDPQKLGTCHFAQHRAV